VQESREALAAVEGECTYAGVAAADGMASLRANLEAIVELSEGDPAAARQALWRLQADWPALERIERQVGGEPEQAALRLGAAIHLARAELASPAPQLRERLPELLELLGASG
jgi:hypothetical protein